MESQTGWHQPSSVQADANHLIKDSNDTSMWECIGQLLPTSDLTSQYWWNTAGRALAILLFHAGYSTDAQVHSLIFFTTVISRELGPMTDGLLEPRQWTSFMTDDGSPLELSWDWGIANASPQVRIAIEPIGPEAGTKENYENQYAGLNLLRRLSCEITTVDLKWFNHLAEGLRVFEPLASVDAAIHRSRCFVGFNLGSKIMDVKAYLRLMSISRNASISAMEELSGAISHLPDIDKMRPKAFRLFQNYVQERSQRGDISVEGLSVDCVEPCKARIKLYVRSKRVSFDSIVEFMTLDGQLDSPNLIRGFEDLRHLWDLLFENNGPMPSVLPAEAPSTAGLIYNFELRHGVSVPVPKVYLPVRHHCQSDTHITEALRTFFRRHGDNNVPIQGYNSAMDAIFSPTYMKAETGIQTYISCSFGTTGLKLVTYINPQLQKLR